MRIPITVHDLGTGEEPMRICGWLVDIGDLVVAGDLIVEVVIPGISVEIMAESTGRLVEIAKQVDSTIKPGDILGWLEDGEIESLPDPGGES